MEQRERYQKWLEAHPGKSKEHSLNWYYRNRDEVLAKNRTPERKAKRALECKVRQQRPEVKERHRISSNNWYQRHRAEVLERNRQPDRKSKVSAYQRRRRKENFNVHFMNWLRGSINRCLRERGQKRFARTYQYIGCTPAELVAHLELQFAPGMTWNVPRSWDVDHIVPSSVFNLADPEEAMIAFNYQNLRPLDRIENQKKSDTIPSPLPTWLPPEIASRITNRQLA